MVLRLGRRNKKRSNNKIITAINKILRSSITVKSKEELGKMCLEVAQKLTGAKFGYIGEVNKENTFNTIAISDPGWVECKIPDSEAAKQINNMKIRGMQFLPLKKNKSYIFNNPSTHPESVGIPEGHPEITCLLAIPIKHKGNTIGQISLGNKPGGFSHQDQRAIEGLSTAIIEALLHNRTHLILREREILLRATIESTSDGILVVDNGGKVILSNQRFAEMWRIPESLVQSRDDQKLLEYVVSTLKHRKAFLSQVQELYNSPKEAFDTLEFKDGRMFERHSFPLLIDERISGRVWRFRDITEREERERKLKESEEKFRGLFEGALYPIIISNMEGRVIDVNNSAVKTFGYEKNDLTGKLMSQLDGIPRESVPEINWIFKDINKGIVPDSFEIQIIKKNMKKTWVSIFPSLVQIIDDLYIHLIIQDISQQKLARREVRDLTKSLQELNAILESAPLAILILNPQGEILRANRKTEELFEVQGEDLEILNIRNLLNNNYLEIYDQHLMSDIYDLSKPNKVEVEALKNLSIPFFIEIRSDVLKIEEQLLIISFISDITERKKYEMERELLLEQLQTTLDYKSKFLAGVSHDLRTPLNAIIGFSDLMLEEVYGDLNEEQRNSLLDIYSSAEDLLSLINDLLDISKIEAGELKMDIQPIDLGQIVKDIHKTIQPLYKVKNLQFKIIGLEAPLLIHVDPIRFKQIMYNLLSNAIKYTKKGEIILKIIDNTDHWEFNIIDTGIGIAQKDFHLVFQEFLRINSPDIHEIRGTGLGLSLTKRLVNLHGGNIWFQSEFKKGSTFYFTIPKRV